jgi:Zn-finger nucleic acid-binding protein
MSLNVIFTISYGLAQLDNIELYNCQLCFGLMLLASSGELNKLARSVSSHKECSYVETSGF